MNIKHEVENDSDALYVTRMEHPSTAGELGRFVDRLEIILKGRSARSFARAAGVSETVFRKYVAGISEPTRPALIAMAVEAGVRAGWLAAGEEPMLRNAAQAASDSASQAMRLDPETLVSSIASVDAGLDVLDVTMAPADKARLVMVVYRRLVERQLEPAEVVASVLQAIKNAVSR